MSETFEAYLNQIGRYPLLTAAQEIELSRQIRRMVELRDLKKKSYSKAEQRAIKIGQKAKEKLIRHNLRLVVHICRKFWNRSKFTSLEMNDFVQEGALGLDRASEMFDGSKGYKFSTYAYWWIKQSLRRAIDNKERLIRIPVHATEKILAIHRFSEAYRKEHHRNPTFKEIAVHIEASVEWVELLLTRLPTHCSLDLLTGKGGDTSIISLIADPRTADQDAIYDELETPDAHRILESGFNALEERERIAIIMRYGLNGDEPAPLSKIGQQFGISRERTRQIVKRATNRLRHHVRYLSSQPPPQALPQSGPLRSVA